MWEEKWRSIIFKKVVHIAGTALERVRKRSRANP
jgi:hypothetical protein